MVFIEKPTMYYDEKPTMYYDGFARFFPIQMTMEHDQEFKLSAVISVHSQDVQTILF